MIHDDIRAPRPQQAAAMAVQGRWRG
jgi:hypothetical protein